MLSLFGVTVVVLYMKILIGSRNYQQRVLTNISVSLQCFPGRPPVNRFLKVLHNWLQEKIKEPDRPLRPAALRLFYNMHKV